MEKDIKKPQIRFQGFTEEWEQHKFKNTVAIERGGSPRPIENFITDSEDGLNWVKIGDAPEQGNYITKTKEKIKSEGLTKTREVHPGDLILSNSMSFGKPYIMGIDGCIHDGWLLIRDVNEIFDLKYLCCMLGTEQMLSQYKAMAAGSTVNNLNKELVGNTIIKYPSKNEQMQIGKFFSQVDNLITLHQRKYDSLIKVKKSMLEKMFPKSGDKKPEIRFVGFTDDWKQHKIEDMCTIVTKQTGFDYTNTIKKSLLNNKEDNTLPYIQTKNFSGIEFDYNTDYYIPIDVANQFEKIILDSKCLLFSIVGASVGNIAFFPNTTKCFLSGAICVAKPQNENDTAFMYYYMSSDCGQKQIKTVTKGSGQATVTIEDIRKFNIALPSQDEIEQISNFLYKFDNLISLHQRKLNLLKNIKKAMLEKMFV